ncbi:MAG: glycosyltransferase [Acidobacteriota bacterium]|nr:glycosyltransferase [Acidobacteriota bacterium]
MASILIVTRGLPSVLYQSVELARRLAAAGHRLTCAGDPDARALIEHHGLAMHRLDPDRYERFLEEDAATPALGRILDIGRRRERARESLGVGAFARFVRNERPDLILINGEMHAHIIAASTTGSRVALLNSFVSIWRHPGVPPPHTLARPGVGWSGTRVGAALFWLALRLRKQYRRWSGRVRRIGCDRVSVYRDLARTVGFAFARETDEGQWLMPFTYRHLPVLSLHAQEFEFPHTPPAHVRFVGPMVLESRIDQPQTAADRDRLEAILARRRSAGTDGRLIYAGFGSVFSTDLAFLRRLVGIVEERTGWELVVSLSHRVAPSDLGPLPARVHTFPWVPQVQVLQHTDVAVTHGGISSVDECVLSGVPMLVYCGWETDMAGTTARVAHHGLGIAGDRQRDTTADIRAYVDRLLTEPGFRERVRHLQGLYAAYAEHHVAERAVDALLARPAGDHGIFTTGESGRGGPRR